MQAKPSTTPKEDFLLHQVESHDQLRKRNSSPIHQLGHEDLVGGAAIIVTTEDIAEVDEFGSFSPEHIREFVEFVSAGLPEVFLRCHPNLLDANTQDWIREVIDELSDRSLQRYLRSRFTYLKEYSQVQEARTARSSDKKKTTGRISKW